MKNPTSKDVVLLGAIVALVIIVPTIIIDIVHHNYQEALITTIIPITAFFTGRYMREVVENRRSK